MRISTILKMMFLIGITTAELGYAGNLNGVWGGMSGGGGETIEVDSIDIGALGEVVDNGRAELLMFFNALTHRQYQDWNPEPLEFQKLYSGFSTIIDAIEQFGVYLNQDQYRPCKDASGVAVDGSVVSPRPKTICLSMWRLQSKLSKGTARAQVLALMAHEYSHLIGFNEDEATALQKRIVPLLEEDSGDHVKARFEGYNNGFIKLRGALIIDSGKVMDSKDWNYYCNMSSALLRYFAQIRELSYLKQYSPFDAIQEKKFLAYYMKTSAFKFGSCAQSPSDPNRNVNLSRYDQIFGSVQVMPVQQWTEHWNDWTVDGGIYVSRLTNYESAQSELKSIREYVEVQYSRASFIDNLYFRGRTY